MSFVGRNSTAGRKVVSEVVGEEWAVLAVELRVGAGPSQRITSEMGISH